MRTRMLGVATAIASLLVMKSAAAQDKGFALQQFEPAPAGDRFFGVPDAHVTGTQPYVMLLGNYAYKPLSLRQQNASGGYDNIATIAKNQFYLHIDATMTIADRLLINVDVPIALAQSGDSTTSNGAAINNNLGSGLADIRAGGRINIVGAAADAFALGVGGDVWLPTGKQDKGTGDENLRGAPKLYISGNTGSFVYSANVGYMFRHYQDLGTPKVGNAIVFGAAAGVVLADGMVQVGPEIYGNTVTQANQNGDSTDKTGLFLAHRTPLEAILGGRFRVNDIVLGVGAGPGLSKAPGTPAFRALGSVAFVPEVKVAPGDRDHDGITDDKDACPDTAGVPNADPKLNGCPPPPPPDRDHDGIADPQDACPDVAGVANADPAKNGCPADRDGDGIPDAQDACPDAPGVKDADPKKNGCPPDRDGDGIADAQDACPDVAGVKSDDPKKNGCPPDKDGDGIPDNTDACPDVAGVADPDPKKNGCPHLATLVGKEIKIAEQVHFETGKSVIKADSDKLLGEVAAIMKEHTEIASMSIEGHTDSKGAKGANKQLSQARAEAVKKWLSAKGGVDAKRMSAKGFGQDKPLQTNDTEDGRAANRRVEFHVETKDAADAPKAPPPAAPKAPPPAKPKKLDRQAEHQDGRRPSGPAPVSFLSPQERAITRSAAAAVVARWVTSSTVRCPRRRPSVARNRRSDSPSRLAVGSSRRSTGCPVASARASDTQARSPPDSARPDEPRVTSSSACAKSAPASTESSSRARSGEAASARLSSSVPATTGASCGTHAKGRVDGPTLASVSSSSPYRSVPDDASRPSSARSRDVLPAPVGPTSATISPGDTSAVTRLDVRRAPNAESSRCADVHVTGGFADGSVEAQRRSARRASAASPARVAERASPRSRSGR